MSDPNAPPERLTLHLDPDPETGAVRWNQILMPHDGVRFFEYGLHRATSDTATEWHYITGSSPPNWERVYERIEPGTPREILLVGNITKFSAGFAWILVVNGRILRQSELSETISKAMAECNDFRDRIVAMWND